LASVAGLGLYDLQWAVMPWSLLRGRIAADVQARQPDGFVNTRVELGFGAIRLFNLQGTTTLATLGQLVPLGDIQGLLSVQIDELELRDNWPVRAVGQVRLAQLQTPLLMPGGPSGLIPLGSFLVTLLDSDAPELTGRFEDQGGPLEIAGSLTLTSSRGYSLAGLVRPRSDAPEEIVQALQFLTGAPDAEGRRPFELSGSL